MEGDKSAAPHLVAKVELLLLLRVVLLKIIAHIQTNISLMIRVDYGGYYSN